MSRVTSLASSSRVIVLLPAIATVVLLVFWGMVSQWPKPVVAVAAAGSVALLLLLVAAIRSSFDFRHRWLSFGTAVITIALVAVAVACAVTVFGRWVGLPERNATDVTSVADEASTVARLLTTVPEGDRSQYLSQLRPHITDDVYNALATNVVGLIPPAPYVQSSVVTSVSVEVVNDGAATAIAVVRPTPPPTTHTDDADPNDVILFLILARYDNRWVAANLAPLGVRSSG